LKENSKGSSVFITKAILTIGDMSNGRKRCRRWLKQQLLEDQQCVE